MAETLPTIGGTFAASYGFLWRHAGELARRLPLPAAATALLAWTMARLETGSLLGLLIVAVVFAVALAVFVRFMVAWHRLVQFGTVAAGPPLRLRFVRRDRKLLGLTALYGLVLVAADGVVRLFFRALDAPLAGALAIALVVAFVYFAVRLCLAFAAIAADDAPALLLAWSLTRQGAGRLALALLAVLAPWVAVAFLISRVVVPLGGVGVAVADGVVSVIGGALLATALSTIYRDLLGRFPEAWRTPATS